MTTIQVKPSRGRIAVLGIAAALTAFAAIPASAFPASGVGAGAQQLSAAASPVEKVRCNDGCKIGIGVAAGVVAGAAIANSAQRQRYYDDGYGRGDGYGPVYYRSSPGPRYGRCWIETNPYRGTGYWGRC